MGVVIVDTDGTEFGRDAAALREKLSNVTIGPHMELVGHSDVMDWG